MTYINNKKTILCTIFTLMAITGIAYGITATNANAMDSQTKFAELSIKNNPGPDKYRLTGDSIMTSSANVDTIIAKRGQTTSVMITLTHEAGKNPNASFTVTPKVTGYIIPPSVLTSTTMQERATMLGNGIVPKGVIPIKDLVTFVPESVELNAGESKEVEMRIFIPNEFSSEVQGNITISPHFDINNKIGVDRLGLFSYGVDVDIQG